MPCGVSVYEITGTAFALCWISKAGEICPLIALNLFALNFVAWTLFLITWRLPDSTEIKLDYFFFFVSLPYVELLQFFSLRAVPSTCTCGSAPRCPVFAVPPWDCERRDRSSPAPRGERASTENCRDFWQTLDVIQNDHSAENS